MNRCKRSGGIYTASQSADYGFSNYIVSGQVSYSDLLVLDVFYGYVKYLARSIEWSTFDVVFLLQLVTQIRLD